MSIEVGAASFAELADRSIADGALAAAARLLDQAIACDDVNFAILMKCAAIRRATGDLAGALVAIDRALEHNPLDFIALLMRASLMETVDPLRAGELHGRALAQRPPGDLPEQLKRQIAHAEKSYSDYQERINRRLVEATSVVALAGDEAARVDRFRTNSLRLSRRYYSEPTDYDFPGLVESEFHDRRAFPWLQDFETATDAIAKEFSDLIASEHVDLVPYVQYPKGVPLRQWEALNHASEWSAIHLILNGKIVESHARHCPSTLAMLAKLPQPQIDGVSPNAFFSLLAPGAHIPPHHGVANTRLICHLPLVVPDGCWFRVGAERRPWERGHAFVFDDTIEHEARNEGGALRVVFICDVWHPGLSEAERAAVTALVQAREAIGDAGS